MAAADTRSIYTLRLFQNVFQKKHKGKYSKDLGKFLEPFMIFSFFFFLSFSKISTVFRFKSFSKIGKVL